MSCTSDTPISRVIKKGVANVTLWAGNTAIDHSVINYGKCVVAHPSDMAPALIALNASAIIAASNAERQVPLQDFFLSPDDYTETVLKPGELLVEVRVPNESSKDESAIFKTPRPSCFRFCACQRGNGRRDV